MSNVIEERLITLSTTSDICIFNNGTFKSDVDFNFKSVLKDEKDILKASISVISAQIPVSYYNINIYNNILKVVNSSVTYTITLTTGNYTSTTLQTLLSTLFIAQGLNNFLFAYSTTSGKLTITNTTSFSILHTGSTCLGVLGFESESDTLSSLNAITGLYTVIGTYPLNLLGTLRVRVLSTKLLTFNLDSSISGGVSLLASIPVEAPPYSVILYDNFTKASTELKSLKINSIDIQLVDDLGNLLQLNNIDWSITLAIYIERKRTDRSTSDFNDIVVKPIVKELVNLENLISGGNNQGDSEDGGDTGDTGYNPTPTDTEDLFDMFYDNDITL
jgi:hypothetical protein